MYVEMCNDREGETFKLGQKCENVENLRPNQEM